MLITFNNPLKAFFSNKKYPITIRIQPAKIVNSIFLIVNPIFNEFKSIIDVKNQLPISFGTLLAYNKILKVRNSTSRQTNIKL